MAAASASATNYGIDAAPLIGKFALAGAALLLAVGLLPERWLGAAAGPVFSTAFITGVIFLLEAALMLAYARWGKYRHRARMLALVPWRGTEQVLDVGTGRGLLLCGAARHLTGSGRATGIDIWNAEDLSGNNAANALLNAETEGVADKVQIENADARHLPFADASFEVVLSNLCLHNIASAEGRAQACREIARVLRPGGRAVLSDFRHNGEYVRALQAAGCTVQRGFPRLFDTFPPLTVLVARRPG